MHVFLPHTICRCLGKKEHMFLFTTGRYDKPQSYYWGEVVLEIDTDRYSKPKTFRMKFMKRVREVGNPSERMYDWPKADDFDNISADRFIAGPRRPSLVSTNRRGGGFFSFCDGEEIVTCHPLASIHKPSTSGPP